ncbi:MAG: HNH endonuclease [Clostridiales bacterium]|nr:HNH endonuclease [Clostridiales bacterium]
MKDWARGFYTSQAWIVNSKAYIASQHGECERCRAAGVEGSVAKIAHHKIYLTSDNIHDPRITMAWDNLEALCQDCHNKEHHRKNKKRCYYFDKHGNMHKA